MLKTTIALSLITSSLLAGGNASNESSARLDALGLNVYQTEDNYNIWANPAFMTKYSSEATVNLRGQDTSSVMAGGNVGTSAGVFGIYFGRPSTNNTANMENAVAGVGFTNPIIGVATPIAVNQFDLMYAIDVSNMAIGARVSRKAFSDSATIKNAITNTSTQLDSSASELEFEAGVVFKDLGLDVSATIGLPDYEVSATTSNVGTSTTNDIQDDSALTFSIQGGYNLPLNEVSKLRFNLLIANDSLGSKTNDSLNDISETRDESALGVLGTVTYDANITESTKMYLSGGLAYGSRSFELKDGNTPTGKGTEDFSALVIPVSGAVESNINSSWVVRAGAELNNFVLINSFKEDDGTVSTDAEGTAEMEVALNIGLGYSPIDAVNIDAVITQGNLFGGDNVFEDLTSKITGTYRF